MKRVFTKQERKPLGRVAHEEPAGADFGEKMELGIYELVLDLIRVLINSDFVEDADGVKYCPLCHKDVPTREWFPEWDDESMHKDHCAIPTVGRLIRALRKMGWIIDKGPGI